MCPQHGRVLFCRDLKHQLELPEQAWEKAEGFAFLSSNLDRYDDPLLGAESMAKHRMGKAIRIRKGFDHEMTPSSPAKE